ncbi:hypothetical protein ES703_45541 [subsurface metagenome]
MIDLIPIGIVLSTVISLVFTVYFVKRASKGTRNTLEDLGRQLKQGILDINEQLKPIIDANSRAMGVVSRLSDSGKMDKALESRIGKDLMGQNEDILEVIKMAFPNVAEYIEDHPEAITKLMPRLNTLISDPEARKRLNLDLSGAKSDLSRIWEDERG